MVNYFKIIFVTGLLLTSCDVTAADTIYREKLIDGISIQDIDVNESGEDYAKIIVKKYKLENPNIDESQRDMIPKPKIKYGDLLMEISSKNLPVTNGMCLDIDEYQCDEYTDGKSDGKCTKGCVVGIESLAYDKNKGILYFASYPDNLGTGGGIYFIFSADIKTKKIIYLTSDLNPLNATLSPTGKYLLTYSYNGITIYDTESKKKSAVEEDNIWTEGHERLNYVGDIKWLSDSRFSYQDAIKHDKFQEGNDEMYEKIYDISTQKILQSRLMDKKEYEHLMHK